jgi:thiazole synthase
MLQLYGTALRSRLLLGSARYPSPAVLTEAV